MTELEVARRPRPPALLPARRSVLRGDQERDCPHAQRHLERRHERDCIVDHQRRCEHMARAVWPRDALQCAILPPNAADIPNGLESRGVLRQADVIDLEVASTARRQPVWRTRDDHVVAGVVATGPEPLVPRLPPMIDGRAWTACSRSGGTVGRPLGETTRDHGAFPQPIAGQHRRARQGTSQAWDALLPCTPRQSRRAAAVHLTAGVVLFCPPVGPGGRFIPGDATHGAAR